MLGVAPRPLGIDAWDTEPATVDPVALGAEAAGLLVDEVGREHAARGDHAVPRERVPSLGQDSADGPWGVRTGRTGDVAVGGEVSDAERRHDHSDPRSEAVLGQRNSRWLAVMPRGSTTVRSASRRSPGSLETINESA